MRVKILTQFSLVYNWFGLPWKMTKATPENKEISHIEYHPLTKKSKYGFDLTGFISKEDFSQTLQENSLASHFHSIKKYHFKAYTDFKTCPMIHLFDNYFF